MARTAKSAGLSRSTAKRQTRPGRHPAGASVRSAKPKLSKDELRARVEKLERANATLRAKNRESTRAAKEAAARIAELEDEVARLRREQDNATRPARRPRSRRELDPGDAVPPGVAVEEPASPDLEAETARENLEHHLKDE